MDPLLAQLIIKAEQAHDKVADIRSALKAAVSDHNAAVDAYYDRCKTLMSELTGTAVDSDIPEYLHKGW